MRARSPKVLCGSEQSWQSQNRRVPHTWTADRGAAAQSESPAVRHVLSTTASTEHRCCLITEPQLKRQALHISSPALCSVTSLLLSLHAETWSPLRDSAVHTHTQQTYHFLYFTVYFVFYHLSSLTFLSWICFLAFLPFICFLSSFIHVFTSSYLQWSSSCHPSFFISSFLHAFLPYVFLHAFLCALHFHFFLPELLLALHFPSCIFLHVPLISFSSSLNHFHYFFFLPFHSLMFSFQPFF